MEQENKRGDVDFDKDQDFGSEKLNRKDDIENDQDDLELDTDREHLSETGKKPEDAKGSNLNAQNPSGKGGLSDQKLAGSQTQGQSGRNIPPGQKDDLTRK